jgi:hypothetical protein
VNLVTELHAIVAALNAAGLEYAVVGGLAVTNRSVGLADLARLEENDG